MHARVILPALTMQAGGWFLTVMFQCGITHIYISCYDLGLSWGGGEDLFPFLAEQICLADQSLKSLFSLSTFSIFAVKIKKGDCEVSCTF